MKKTSYQDAHLDLLIRMAFEQLEEEDTEQLATSPDPELEKIEFFMVFVPSALLLPLL